jgi:hypothetical protein
VALDWTHGRVPGELGRLLDRLVASLFDERVIPGVELLAGAGGQLVSLDGFRAGRASVQVTGGAPSSAVVTVGQIDETHVRLYTTANCTVDVYLRSR